MLSCCGITWKYKASLDVVCAQWIRYLQDILHIMHTFCIDSLPPHHWYLYLAVHIHSGPVVISQVKNPQMYGSSSS